ncbi:MAG: S24/S26 family peptidase [Candidatus Paraprevotella stercoravium]|uniref:S24/S26 family peptidase n=1 Tax=Candidatus Paraprevotella stercoravium TaxID=2838725 RepID=A0A9E2P0C7_9BACT|nr:S24/S26 family peptidase [Candidatus Paraprevotella stercoravium]
MKKSIRKKIFGIVWKGFSPIRRLTAPASPASRTENTTRVVIPNEIILGQVKELVREGHTVKIMVKGYSMRPFLEHCRDSVILGPFSELKVGDVALAEIYPGKYVLHRIIALDGDQVTLMGDGNLRGKEYCRREKVAAVVRTFIRNGIATDADNEKWKRYARLWGKLLPIRKYLLWIYKLNLEQKS